MGFEADSGRQLGRTGRGRLDVGTLDGYESLQTTQLDGRKGRRQARKDGQNGQETAHPNSRKRKDSNTGSGGGRLGSGLSGEAGQAQTAPIDGKKIQEGDEGEWEKLYAQTHSYVERSARAGLGRFNGQVEDHDDASSQAFLEAVKNKGKIGASPNPQVLIGGTAYKRSIDIQRRTGRRYENVGRLPTHIDKNGDIEEVDIPDGGTSLEDSFLHREQLREVMKAVRGLPTLQRETFLGYALRGQSFEQIAAVNHESPDTAKTRFYRTRAKLKSMFGR